MVACFADIRDHPDALAVDEREAPDQEVIERPE